IAQDADTLHIHIAAPPQVGDGGAHIQRLARAIRDAATRAVAVAGEVEEQRAIAATLMEPRDLFDPLAPIIMNAMAADKSTAVMCREIPGRKRATRAGEAHLFDGQAELFRALLQWLAQGYQQRPRPRVAKGEQRKR